MPSKLVNNTMRISRLPHIWCPGCGHGILMRDVCQAISNLNLQRDKVVIVSGIGCSSRAAGYMDFNTLHTTHGRPIAFATGIKLAKPDLTVIVITGDGDAAAIGTNHLVHAARRNIDLTVVVFNNRIYGMTGGQYSPTTPTGEFGTTAPYGNIDGEFDIPKLAEAAGATFTGRCDCFHTVQAVKLIEDAIRHRGFSLVDGISICPTYYGRKNKNGGAVSMMHWQQEHCVDLKKKERMSPEKKKGYIAIGKFNEDTSVPEYSDEYAKIRQIAGGEAK